MSEKFFSPDEIPAPEIKINGFGNMTGHVTDFLSRNFSANLFLNLGLQSINYDSRFNWRDADNNQLLTDTPQPPQGAIMEITGHCDRENNQIIIYSHKGMFRGPFTAEDEIAQAERTIAHELGHYIFAYFNDGDRIGYDRLLQTEFGKAFFSNELPNINWFNINTIESLIQGGKTTPYVAALMYNPVNGTVNHWMEWYNNPTEENAHNLSSEYHALVGELFSEMFADIKIGRQPDPNDPTEIEFHRLILELEEYVINQHQGQNS